MSGEELPTLRRVVTGHRGAMAVVQSDSEVVFAPISGLDARSAPAWVCDRVPTNDTNVDVDGSARVVDEGRSIVQKNGTNCRYTDLAPGTTVGMHRTTSVDVNVLIQGELVLIMEDGSETHLKNPGDTVVMRGTLHGWRNPGKTWTRWVCTLVDAQPAIVGGKELGNEWRV